MHIIAKIIIVPGVMMIVCLTLLSATLEINRNTDTVKYF
jgi:hypothetical protein